MVPYRLTQTSSSLALSLGCLCLVCSGWLYRLSWLRCWLLFSRIAESIDGSITYRFSLMWFLSALCRRWSFMSMPFFGNCNFLSPARSGCRSNKQSRIVPLDCPSSQRAIPVAGPLIKSQLERSEDVAHSGEIVASYTGVDGEKRLPLRIHVRAEELSSQSCFLVYWFELDWTLLFKGRAVSRMKWARFELDRLIKES